MNDVSYDVQREDWYTPIKVINEFEKLRDVFGGRVLDPVFKRAREMFTAAVTLLGAYELSQENKYFLQSNNQTATPDVMAASQTEMPDKILLEMIQMEMVEMGENTTTNDVVEFLEKTKFSPKKGYTDKDMIVLVINKNMPYDFKEIYMRLKKLNPKPVIYMIGRPRQQDFGTFAICNIAPQLTKPLEYNVITTAAKYSLPERVSFSRAMDKKIKYTKQRMKPVDTYDILGLDKKIIFKKLKII